MGFFKGIKDMKDMVVAAPGMIDQAQTLGAQAQQMAAAQQAAADQQLQAAQQAHAAALAAATTPGQAS